MTVQFERRVEVTPAFDKRDSDPNKNYGVGGCRIWFYLIGPKGAIAFQIGTDWYPLHIQRDRYDRGDRAYSLGQNFYRQPQAWDIGYHAKQPQYEDQSPMKEKCHVIGCKCFYDGSSLQANDMIEPFIMGGTDYLWPELERRYYIQFEAKE